MTKQKKKTVVLEPHTKMQQISGTDTTRMIRDCIRRRKNLSLITADNE